MVDDFSYHGKKHIKRDYYNKTFINPYKKKKKLGPQFNTKLYIQILTAIFLVYLIIYSDLFKVNRIEAQGTDMINPQELETLVWNDISRLKLLIFPGRNLLFINTSKIKKEIEAKYALNKLSIKKSWQKLEITVEERIANLIAKTDKSYYFIDSSGLVTKELTAEDVNKYQGKFPLLRLNYDLKVNEKPISERAVNYIIELDKAFKDNKIKVKDFESGEVDQVSVVTEAGWKAHFSINSSLSQAMENMLLVLNKKLAGRKFDYIDLRFGDRVNYFPEN